MVKERALARVSNHEDEQPHPSRRGQKAAPQDEGLLHRRAEIKALALGRLSGGGLQHQVENALAALLHRFLAVEDGAAIDVHVVFHALEHRRVGRKLDRGCRLAAEYAAAPGGEAHQVVAATGS